MMKRFKVAFASILAMGAVFCCGSLLAETTYLGDDGGDWNERDNWSAGVPDENTDAVVEGKTVVATGSIVAKSLTLTDATLRIGNKSDHIAPRIVEDLTLNGASRLYVSAGEIPSEQYETVFDTDEHAIAAIRAAANIVTIGGSFIVKDTSVVYPECGEITGVPVIFKVAKDFTVEAGASFNATGLGWGWATDKWEDYHPTHARACMRYDWGWTDYGWTFAIGTARGPRANGANYGDGTAKVWVETRDPGVSFTFEGAYGFAVAPFLPGSPSAVYGNLTSSASVRTETARGAGSVVVFSQGTATVDGMLVADGLKGKCGGSSGGGVMLAAQSVAFGNNAFLSARGGDSTYPYFGARGGRIALLVGYTDEQLTGIMAGNVPEGSLQEPSITRVSASADGGTHWDGNPFNPGTCRTLLSSTAQTVLTTQSDVPGLIATGVTWGDEVLLNGDYERTAPQYAYLAEDATIRYTCQGYVVSNKNGEVSFSDVERTARFTIDGSEGPYSLTWKWGDRTVIDPDPVSRHWVGGSSGSLMEPNNWDPAGMPTRVDELYITNAAVSASRIQVAKLVLSGGSLTVGSSTTREAIGFSVTGDVMVCDGATLNVYAPLKTDPAGYASVAAARLLLWQNRTTVSIGGALTVEAGSTVQVSNHPETGDLVVFEVGSFDLAAGGTVTAAGGGFTWLPVAGKTLPEGTIRLETTGKFNNVAGTPCYTYGFGSALDWQKQGYVQPGGHGNVNCRPYGLDFAPFEPGSPGVIGSGYMTSSGGGSIVVLAKGVVMLAGTLNADGTIGNGAGSSGGSIWIAGDTIAYGDGLVATARGVAYNNSLFGAGDGGRIAFMTDVTTAEQVETMVGGTKLEGFTYTALSQAGVSVDGGRRVPTDVQPTGNPGTAVSAFSKASYELVTVTASPLEATSAKAAYGEYQFRGGETVEREADVIGGDPVDPQNVRYICTGYVVSNETEQVAEGKTTTLSFPVVKGAGPYTVTWLWGIRETRSRLSVTGPGTVTVNGQTVSELWIPDTEDVVFAATPDAGKAFWAWSGVDVPAASVAKSSFTIPADKPHVVNAVFVDLSAAAKTCTFKTTANGDFYDPANWEGVLVPNPQDAVVIPGGACTVLGRLAVGSLAMTGGSLSVAQVEDVAIAGDVTLSGGSVWTISALPTNTATAFADGATRVVIGGNLAMADTTTVKPVSDPWTGGSVVFAVAGSFTLGEGAKFDAVGAGWNWIEYLGDPSPCAVDTFQVGDVTYQTMALGCGYQYLVGGSYGGRGGSASVSWDWRVKDVYGFANAPFYPGSPNGVLNTTSYRPGGGLIRIHVVGKATVNGILDASAAVDSSSGGASGGGIWLTAGRFAFGATARLLAKGGPSWYASQGGGGRIAIGTGLTAGQMASLLATGRCARKVSGLEVFQTDCPGVTVDVSRGESTAAGRPIAGDPGTFSYYPAPKGLMLLVK